MAVGAGGSLLDPVTLFVASGNLPASLLAQDSLFASRGTYEGHKGRPLQKLQSCGATFGSSVQVIAAAK